jgi:hypothetical protein
VTVWRWVHHEQQTLQDVGVLGDGSLHNPNGYPDDLVREAVAAANERRYQRRSKAAKKAAETRRRRTKERVYDVVERIEAGGSFGPASHCCICGRGLDDSQSIRRGIGSECWQSVLAGLERKATA